MVSRRISASKASAGEPDCPCLENARSSRFRNGTNSRVDGPPGSILESGERRQLDSRELQTALLWR
eukprot:7941952-Pyramimonas_sp.AAC.1